MREGEFADAPVSVGEARAKRSENAGHWTSRDVLVSLLRRIDQGEVAPKHLVVLWVEGNRDRDDDGEAKYLVATQQDLSHTLGTIELCKAQIMFDGALES